MRKTQPLLRVSNRMQSKLHVRYNNLSEIEKLRERDKPVTLRPELGITVDISREGISLLAPKRPKLADILEFQMSLPLKRQTKRIRLKGIVRWSRPKAPNEYTAEAMADYHYICGVEFLKSKDVTDVSVFIEYMEWMRK